MADTLTGAVQELTQSQYTIRDLMAGVTTDFTSKYPKQKDVQALNKLWGKSAQEFGNALTRLPATFQNEFIETLVNRISMTLIRDTELSNPLARFKKGIVPLGGTVQEIAVNVSKGYSFDASKSANRLYKLTKPDVIELFHITRRDMTYPLSIEFPTLQRAFAGGWENFDSFIAQLFKSVLNSNINDEYQAMKQVVSNSVLTNTVGTTRILSDGDTTQEQLSQIQAQMLSIRSKMQYNSSLFNNAGVMTATPKDRIKMIITADLEAKFNADFYTRFFNDSYDDMDMLVVDNFADIWQYGVDHTVVQADFDNEWLSPDDYDLGQIIPEGTHASAGAADANKVFDGSTIGWVIGDLDNWYQVYDQFTPQFIPQSNAAGRYVNYFLQENQVISHSELSNAVVGIFDGGDTLAIPTYTSITGGTVADGEGPITVAGLVAPDATTDKPMTVIIKATNTATGQTYTLSVARTTATAANAVINVPAPGSYSVQMYEFDPANGSTSALTPVPGVVVNFS